MIIGMFMLSFFGDMSQLTKSEKVNSGMEAQPTMKQNLLQEFYMLL